MDDDCSLKVLHLASGDLWAGAEVQLLTLAKGLVEKSPASVQVVLLNHGRLENELLDADIGVIVHEESRLNSLQLINRLIHTFRTLAPDVIHTHRMKENVLGSIAALLTGIPSLRTVHGAPEHRPTGLEPAKRARFFLDRFCGRVLQRRIIAVSSDLARILMEHYPPEKIRVIQNAIDPAAEQAGIDTQGRETRSGSGFRIGYAGRLVAVKRPDIFVQTARCLLDDYPDLEADFYLYGDGPLRGELEQLIKELEVEDSVHIEGHSDDMTLKLQELDVLLMTSDHEGLPMVLLEAMALKTPIITNAVGGIPELLDQGSCGILVEEHTGSGYAREIHNLLKNPVKRAEIVQKALQRLRLHYSVEQLVKSYCAVYSEIHSAG